MRACRSAIVAGVLAVGATGALAPPARAATFPVRMVKAVQPLASEAARTHLSFSRELGFNALFVTASEAGVWTARDAPRTPKIHAGFLETARWCRENGLRIFVSLNPVAESWGTFRFSSRDGERRIRKFVALLRRKAGVRDFILSFDDQPIRLEDLGDALRYGAYSAPAHLDLARRLVRSIPADGTFWLCAAAYNDAHLGDGSTPYAKAFLAGLPALPPEVGIVWTGTSVFSPSLTRGDLAATAARLGHRRLFLYDNYPVNDDANDALALILGPLRERDPRLAEVASVYLSCPMADLGASRLPLRTVAAWLRDPEAYDPDAALRHAIDLAAGGDPAARLALETQVLEWGGWIGTANWLPRSEANPERVAAQLDDPARVALLTWTVERYPSRMAALTGLADEPFRDDLLRVMNRKLAVARSVPLVQEYLARKRAGRADAAVAWAAIEDERAAAAFVPDARRVLDLFLRAAEVP